MVELDRAEQNSSRGTAGYAAVSASSLPEQPAAQLEQHLSAEESQEPPVKTVEHISTATVEQLAEKQRRRREIEIRVQEAREKQKREQEENEREQRELREENVVVPIEQHVTGLLPQQIPMPFSTVVPVFLHEECDLRKERPKIVRAMTLPTLLQTYGKDVYTAVGDAFGNLKKPGGPLQDFEDADVFRHGLCVYIQRHPRKTADAQLDTSLISSFLPEHARGNKIITTLIDPEHMENCVPQLRVGCAINEGKDARGAKIVIMAVAVILCEIMDVWHTANRQSPAHGKYRAMLQKKLHQRVGPNHAQSSQAVESSRPYKSQADLDKEQKEEAEDEEFRAMSFEDILKEEKLRGKLKLSVDL